MDQEDPKMAEILEKQKARSELQPSASCPVTKSTSDHHSTAATAAADGSESSRIRKSASSRNPAQEKAAPANGQSHGVPAWNMQKAKDIAPTLFDNVLLHATLVHCSPGKGVQEGAQDVGISREYETVQPKDIDTSTQKRIWNCPFNGKCNILSPRSDDLGMFPASLIGQRLEGLSGLIKEQVPDQPVTEASAQALCQNEYTRTGFTGGGPSSDFPKMSGGLLEELDKLWNNELHRLWVEIGHDSQNPSLDTFVAAVLAEFERQLNFAQEQKTILTERIGSTKRKIIEIQTQTNRHFHITAVVEGESLRDQDRALDLILNEAEKHKQERVEVFGNLTRELLPMLEEEYGCTWDKDEYGIPLLALLEWQSPCVLGPTRENSLAEKKGLMKNYRQEMEAQMRKEATAIQSLLFDIYNAPDSIGNLTEDEDQE